MTFNEFALFDIALFLDKTTTDYTS